MPKRKRPIARLIRNVAAWGLNKQYQREVQLNKQVELLARQATAYANDAASQKRYLENESRGGRVLTEKERDEAMARYKQSHALAVKYNDLYEARKKKGVALAKRSKIIHRVVKKIIPKK